MQLPGGLVEDGVRRRDWAFRPVSGALELALAEAGETAASTPEAVTRVLAAALERLAGAAVTPPRVAALCVADRQFLMRELERHLGNAGGWFAATCRSCGERFDFRVDYAELPVQEARAGYPQAELAVNGRRQAFRLPTGADQERLVHLPEAEAKPWLLRQLAVDGDNAGLAAADIDAAAAAVESALEAVAPAIVLTVGAACPACGGSNEVALDPYQALGRRSDVLLGEVHAIASHYHWSERDILALPRQRRQSYLGLIDRARGLVE